MLHEAHELRFCFWTLSRGINCRRAQRPVAKDLGFAEGLALNKQSLAFWRLKGCSTDVRRQASRGSSSSLLLDTWRAGISSTLWVRVPEGKDPRRLDEKLIDEVRHLGKQGRPLPSKGLPSSFAIDLPDEGPVVIGDFLDEAPPVVHRRAAQPLQPAAVAQSEPPSFTPQIVPPRTEAEREVAPARPVQRNVQSSKVIRYQLNLTPKSKTMFEELMKHVQTFSPEGDTRTSEVFQGVIGVLHSAMDELDLSELPRRGAWGSVTAKNFPNALGGAFEQAIVKAAKKRGVG